MAVNKNWFDMCLFLNLLQTRIEKHAFSIRKDMLLEAKSYAPRCGKHSFSISID